MAAPVQFFDFLPLFQETEESIRARLDSDANQGVPLGSSEFIDTRQGSVFYDLTQALLLEFARLWDALSVEVPAAAFIGTAWGEYLDYHASVLGLERKPAAKSSGEVLFAGTEGTLVPAGIVISARQTDPDVEPPEYVTTESGEITTTLTTPTGLNGTPSTSEGTLVADDYFYTVTAINDIGETLESAETAETLAGTGKIDLAWDDVTNATGYRVYRGLTTGNEKFLVEVVNSEYTDAGAETPTSDDPPSTNTTGGKFRASVEASEPGSAANVGADEITAILTAITGISTVTNEEPVTGGEDVETDKFLRRRLLLEFRGGGSGNIADYERWSLAHPSVGSVTVIPVWDGPGTVKVIIRDQDGLPVSESVVASLQAELDPYPGLGEGLAPIGAIVTVTTPALVTVDFSAILDLEDGYTLDGGGGTIALRERFEEAITIYVDQLESAEDIVYDHAKSRLYTVPGLYKATEFHVDGGTADIPISDSPAEVAVVGTITLDEA